MVEGPLVGPCAVRVQTTLRPTPQHIKGRAGAAIRGRVQARRGPARVCGHQNAELAVITEWRVGAAQHCMCMPGSRPPSCVRPTSNVGQRHTLHNRTDDSATGQTPARRNGGQGRWGASKGDGSQAWEQQPPANHQVGTEHCRPVTHTRPAPLGCTTPYSATPHTLLATGGPRRAYEDHVTRMSRAHEGGLLA